MFSVFRCSVILFACFLLTACETLTVRAPVCEPPAIPTELMAPCPDAAPVVEGTLSSLYQQMLRDTSDWGQCIRAHDKLIAVVKYRDSVCEKIKQDNAKTSGWKWPWQK